MFMKHQPKYALLSLAKASEQQSKEIWCQVIVICYYKWINFGYKLSLRKHLCIFKSLISAE